MENFPVKPKWVWKNKRVTLAKELPLGFYNKFPIHAGATGYVISEGFESGMLKVHFVASNQKTQFNPLSAENFLLCDPYF